MTAISALQQIVTGSNVMDNEIKSRKANAGQLARLISSTVRLNELELELASKNINARLLLDSYDGHQ